MIRQTSLNAYAKISTDGTKSTQANEIYYLIKRCEGLTINEIGRILEMQNSTVSGRVNDLTKAKRIKENGKQTDYTTKKENYIWVVRRKNE